MTVDEDRVRRALTRHAHGIEPDDHTLERIRQGVEATRRRRQRRSAGAATGALAAAVLLVVALASLGGGADQVVETAPAEPSPAPTSPVPPPEAPPPPADAAPTFVPGIWPLHTVADLDAYLASGDTRYDDPVEVARAFAVDYLGMVDPVVGEASGPGERGTVTVVIQPRGESGQDLPDGVMETVVHLGPDGPPWQVLFTTSSDIRIDGDPFRNFVTSPVTVSGQATAYEGTVQVAVRQAGMEAGEALGQDFVTAGALGRLGPFATEVPFDAPSTEGVGALVLFTESAVDGSTEQATVIGLNFGSPTPTTVTATGTTEVSVFLRRGEALVPVARRIPRTTGVLRAALEELLAGPTEAERAQGLSSWFSAETAGLLNEVTLDAEGTAVVDFDDLRPVIPNASTSFGSDQLLGQLDATVFQFPTVDRVEYRLDGSCEAFWMWLQRGCQVVERPGTG